MPESLYNIIVHSLTHNTESSYWTGRDVLTVSSYHGNVIGIRFIKTLADMEIQW